MRSWQWGGGRSARRLFPNASSRVVFHIFFSRSSSDLSLPLVKTFSTAPKTSRTTSSPSPYYHPKAQHPPPHPLRHPSPCDPSSTPPLPNTRPHTPPNEPHNPSSWTSDAEPTSTRLLARRRSRERCWHCRRDILATRRGGARWLCACCSEV